MKEPKKYRVRILMQCGTSQQWIEEYITANDFFATEKGFYYFNEEGKGRYYPINNTIIEEL